MKSLQAQRDQLLHQMGQCTTMEYGALKAEHRPAQGGGTTGPCYKHQVWERGKNLSQRIPALEASALQDAITQRQRFEQLARDFIDLTVQMTRRQHDSDADAKKNARRWRRPSLRKPKPS